MNILTTFVGFALISKGLEQMTGKKIFKKSFIFCIVFIVFSIINILFD